MEAKLLAHLKLAIYLLCSGFRGHDRPSAGGRCRRQSWRPHLGGGNWFSYHPLLSSLLWRQSFHSQQPASEPKSNSVSHAVLAIQDQKQKKTDNVLMNIGTIGNEDQIEYTIKKL